MKYMFAAELTAEAEQAIRSYGEARVQFRLAQKRLASVGLLFGNDNKVGIAGEYWALKYYISQGYILAEMPKHTNNAAFDFTVSHTVHGIKRVSVKAISDENKRGTTSQVKANGNWDELCIVQMNETLQAERFGIASHAAFKSRCKPGGKQKSPANRKWLDQAWMRAIPALAVFGP